MIRDLRFALRRLARSPGFSATVILLLGLTLGANASMFSVLYGLLYKALPFAGADRIVSLDVRMANMGMNVRVDLQGCAGAADGLHDVGRSSRARSPDRGRGHT